MIGLDPARIRLKAVLVDPARGVARAVWAEHPWPGGRGFVRIARVVSEVPEDEAGCRAAWTSLFGEEGRR